MDKNYLRHYLRHRPLFLAVLRAKEAALYQKHIPLIHPVLDVGCGDGFFARVTFGRRVIDVGLDMEASRISEARTSQAYKKIVTYDGRTFPFRSGSFQTVVINSVLEHVSDVEQVVSEIYRVLMPGGTCYATVMAKPWEQYLFGAKFFGQRYRTWMKKKQVHVNLLTATGWQRLFETRGFRMNSLTPYLSSRAGMWLDIFHYISLPSLISYTINGEWVWWKGLTHIYPMPWLSSLMDESVSSHRAGALFIVVQKPR